MGHRHGQLRHTLSGHTGSVWPFMFRGDGAQLAISDDQFTTRLWDTSTGRCQHIQTGHGRQVTSVRFSADSSLLATSGSDGMVRIWDPVTGRQLQRLVGTEDRLVMLEAALFSPVGQRLVTVSNDGRLNLLNLDTGRYERHLDVESAPIWAVAFSPSGDELATANDDDTVRLWYRSTGRLVHTLAEHRGRVRSIAFNSDGSLIATGCDDSAIRLWDAESGKLLQTLRGHTDRVYAVDFGDGILASASWDTTARVWDITSGTTLHTLRQHTRRLWTAAFSPSGDLLATAGDDLVVQLWDPVSRRPLHTLTGHTRSVWSVTFNPAGNRQRRRDHPAVVYQRGPARAKTDPARPARRVGGAGAGRPLQTRRKRRRPVLECDQYVPVRDRRAGLVPARDPAADARNPLLRPDPPTPGDNSVDRWITLCIPPSRPAPVHRPRHSPRAAHARCPHGTAPVELYRRRASTPPTALTTATGVLLSRKTLITRAVDKTPLADPARTAPALSTYGGGTH